MRLSNKSVFGFLKQQSGKRYREIWKTQNIDKQDDHEMGPRVLTQNDINIIQDNFTSRNVSFSAGDMNYIRKGLDQMEVYTLNPQIFKHEYEEEMNLSHIYQFVIMQNIDLVQRAEKKDNEAKDDILQNGREKLVQFMKERPNIFGRINMEDMTEKEQMEYVEQKFSQVMKYSTKDFYDILENK